MIKRINLFYIYIFLITLFKGFGAESDNYGYVLVFIVGTVAIVLKIWQEKYTIKELIIMFFLMALGILTFFFGHSTTLLFTSVALCGMKNVDVYKTIKISLWTRIGSFFCVVCGVLFGVIDNNAIDFYRNGKYIIRSSLGYPHPNMAQAAFTIIVILLLYVYYDKMNFIHYVFLLISECILYKFTFSRTGCLIGIICILLSGLGKIKVLRKMIFSMLRYSYTLLFALTIAVGLLYGKLPILSKIDVIMSGRVQYISVTLHSFVPQLIGSSYINQYVNIDNGYIALLYQCGVLAFVFISYNISKCFKVALEEKNYPKYILLFSFFLYAMTESFFPSVAVNISLLFIGEIIFKQKKGVEIIENNNCIYSDLQ